ncbi:MAG: Phytoene synthase [Ignavibacteriae bacterium]|nr:MAG: Phytoene synthase [Ignavibacteriota bacterium]
MKYDLVETNYNKIQLDEYIYGSADIVGLMCLRVFCKGGQKLYNELEPYAMKLGSGFPED